MSTQEAHHSHCFVCGGDNQTGLEMKFRRTGPDSVEADFVGGREYQGYEGLLQGGIISALVDGAMTNCLFSRDIVAVTAELNVRFMIGVSCDRPLRVTARLERTRGPVYILTAEIIQDGRPVVRARGKFLDKSRA